MKKITLIDNSFTKSELRFLLSELIDTKINFHKLHRLSSWEANHKADTSYDDNRIKELTNILENLDDYINGDTFKVTSEIIIE